MISLRIQGNPIAKKRPRFARKGNFVRTYSDQETEEGKFLLCLKEQYRAGLLQKPLTLEMRFHLNRPQRHFGTGKNAGKMKPGAPVAHTSKPDVDNLVKFALDCMNGIVWTDDSIICEIHASKKYAEKEPFTEILIKETEDGTVV